MDTKIRQERFQSLLEDRSRRPVQGNRSGRRGSKTRPPKLRARDVKSAHPGPISMTSILPPPPWAVRDYFARRIRPNLGGELGVDTTAHNESLWVEVVARGPRAPAPERPDEAEATLDVPVEGASSVTHFRLPPEGRCSECDREFRPRRPWSRFCSDACKMRAHRRRNSKNCAQFLRGEGLNFHPSPSRPGFSPYVITYL